MVFRKKKLAELKRFKAYDDAKYDSLYLFKIHSANVVISESPCTQFSKVLLVFSIFYLRITTLAR